MKTIKAIVVIGGNPNVQEINNDLESYQRICGGSIEGVVIMPLVDADERITCYAHGEAKILNMKPNTWLVDRILVPQAYDYISGNYVITNSDKNGNNTSLTQKQIKDVMDYVKHFKMNREDRMRLGWEKKEND